MSPPRPGGLRRPDRAGIRPAWPTRGLEDLQIPHEALRPDGRGASVFRSSTPPLGRKQSRVFGPFSRPAVPVGCCRDAVGICGQRGLPFPGQHCHTTPSPRLGAPHTLRAPQNHVLRLPFSRSTFDVEPPKRPSFVSLAAFFRHDSNASIDITESRKTLFSFVFFWVSGAMEGHLSSLSRRFL